VALSLNDATLIASASAAAIETRGDAVRGYLEGHQRWLGSNNVYRNDPVSVLKATLLAGGTVNSKHLGEYVAASAPIHVIEGWNYLGRALQSHLSGSADTCRHLAYYAELRAAMALLATQGIGIFNQHHFTIDAAGDAHRLTKNGTHVATWLYLEKWAALASAVQLLGEILRGEGHSLRDWIAALPMAVALPPLAANSLLQFGLDLRRMAEDRAARNEASYRPSMLLPTAIGAGAAVDFAADFVDLLEPQGPSTFEKLDTHFLRRALEAAFRSATNNSARQAPAQFRTAMRHAVDALIDDQPRRDAMWGFLTRQTLPQDAPLLFEASQDALPKDQRHHLQVMCRAALLLRISTGAVGRFFTRSGLSLGSCEVWWRPIGEMRGLWSTMPETHELSDLWVDIAGGIADIQDWRVNAPDPSYRDVMDEISVPLARVSALEALCLVGISS